MPILTKNHLQILILNTSSCQEFIHDVRQKYAFKACQVKDHENSIMQKKQKKTNKLLNVNGGKYLNTYKVVIILKIMQLNTESKYKKN